jgi:hypothetical protein
LRLRNRSDNEETNMVMLTESERRPWPGTVALLVLTLLVLPGVATADEPPAERAEPIVRYGDLVSIFSGDLHVPAGVDRRGTVFSIGGDVVVEGTVHDVVVIGGTLRVTGSVRYQVVGVLSRLDLDGAEVGNQVVNVLGSLSTRSSTIEGQTVNISVGRWFPGLRLLLFWVRVVSVVAAFVVLLLLAALIPERIRLIGEEAPVRYVTAFFVGILGFFAMLIVFGLLSLTLVGLPLALLACYLVRWIGVAGIFYAVGRKLGRAFGAELSLLGAVLATFTLYAALRLAPTFLPLWGLLLSATLWGVFFLLVELPGLGLVILTRLGTSGGALPEVLRSPPAPAPPAPTEPIDVAPV